MKNAHRNSRRKHAIVAASAAAFKKHRGRSLAGKLRLLFASFPGIIDGSVTISPRTAPEPVCTVAELDDHLVIALGGNVAFCSDDNLISHTTRLPSTKELETK